MVIMLWQQFAGMKIETVLTILGRVRFAIVSVFLPPFLQLLAETFGLALCIPSSNPFRVIFKLLTVRIGCDGLLNSLPAGVVVAETLRPVWLHKTCKISNEESLAACVTWEINMAAAEGLILTVIMVLIVLGGPTHKVAMTCPQIMYHDKLVI